MEDFNMDVVCAQGLSGAAVCRVTKLGDHRLNPLKKLGLLQSNGEKDRSAFSLLEARKAQSAAKLIQRLPNRSHKWHVFVTAISRRRDFVAIREQVLLCTSLAGSRFLLRIDGKLMEPNGQLQLAYMENDEADAAVVERVAKEVQPSLFLRARQAEEKGEWEQAIALYETYLDQVHDGDLTAIFNLGNCFAARSRFDAAIQCFRRVTRKLPSFASAWCNLGAMYERHPEGRGQAEHCYRQALAAEPLHKYTLCNLARLLECTDREESQRLWRQYLTIDPRGTMSDTARRQLGVYTNECSRQFLLFS
jgi:tetratricopeptide (TPR) repeat protein